VGQGTWHHVINPHIPPVRFDGDYTAKKRNHHLINKENIMSRRNPSFPLIGSRKKVPDRINIRQITLDEAKALGSYYGSLYVLDRNGNAANVRRNGAVKRWKRDPDRIEVSFKYGMYENFRLGTLEILRDIYVPE